MNARSLIRIAGLACVTACSNGTEPLVRRGNWADLAFGPSVVEWVTVDSGGGSTMVPALDENHLYGLRGSGLITTSGQLTAIDRQSGRVVWTRDNVVARSVAIAGDAIGAIGGGLFVVQRSSGSFRFGFTYPGTSLWGNVVSDGVRFFISTQTGRAVAVNGSSGAIVWDRDLTEGTQARGYGVTLAGDVVVATLKHFGPAGPATDTSFVAALDRLSGVVLWRVVVHPDSVYQSDIIEPAVVSGSTVIVRTRTHDILALDLATGVQRWKFDAAYGQPASGGDGSAACDERVFVGTGDLGVVALDASSGSEVWKRSELDVGSIRQIRCSYGTVMVLDWSKSLLILDAATGQELARYPIKGLMFYDEDFWIASATRDERSIYVATTFGIARIKAP
jgi:outer membrane protein assembly factor BamB